MKWLVTINGIHESSEYPTEVYDFHADDEEAAKEKALKCFRRYVNDTGQEFDNEQDLPIVIMYELPKEPVWVDIANDWKAEQKGVEERRQATIEKMEREQYERLQKKFGK